MTDLITAQALASTTKITPQAPPKPPDGFTLVRYEFDRRMNIGSFTPGIPIDAFASLMVWIPDLEQWVKPKLLVGDADRWFAMKER